VGDEIFHFFYFGHSYSHRLSVLLCCTS
jgi:hypothetical protein